VPWGSRARGEFFLRKKHFPPLFLLQSFMAPLVRAQRMYFILVPQTCWKSRPWVSVCPRAPQARHEVVVRDVALPLLRHVASHLGSSSSSPSLEKGIWSWEPRTRKNARARALIGGSSAFYFQAAALNSSLQCTYVPTPRALPRHTAHRRGGRQPARAPREQHGGPRRGRGDVPEHPGEPVPCRHGRRASRSAPPVLRNIRSKQRVCGQV